MTDYEPAVAKTKTTVTANQLKSMPKLTAHKVWKNALLRPTIGHYWQPEKLSTMPSGRQQPSDNLPRICGRELPTSREYQRCEMEQALGNWQQGATPVPDTWN